MRRKFTGLIYLIMLSIGTILSLYAPQQEAAADQTIVIPKDAIRLRILANSDKPEDQAVKRKIRDEVNASITKWVQDLTSKEEAKKVIQSHLPDIKRIAEKVIAEEHLDQSVRVELGKVNFPTKLYGQYLYPAGKYEAVLITLGEGQGANWWCVLYPPLCFLDFSNGVAVSAGFDEGSTKKEKTEPEEPARQKQTAEENHTQPKTLQKNEEKKQDIQPQEKTEKTAEPKQPDVQKVQAAEKNEDSDQHKKEESAEANAGASPVYVKEETDKVEKKLLVAEIFKKWF
ncbi:stage II sporulation protein R [Heyndrickxia acidiproducens]|uniref:stage II sporulation protein R n=1 Tax=Heyndrickxia acidiproducens TaxID=1121084 RepID=UPI00039DF69C|nr:stage II sporulation protein R [Heyndrickxia acidiproducens]